MAYLTSDVKGLFKGCMDFLDSLNEREQAKFLFYTFHNSSPALFGELETQLRVKKIQLKPLAQQMLDNLSTEVYPLSSRCELKEFSLDEIGSLVEENPNAIIFLKSDHITTEMIRELFKQVDNIKGKFPYKLKKVIDKFPLDDKKFVKALIRWVKKCLLINCKVFDECVNVPRELQEYAVESNHLCFRHMDEDLQYKFLWDNVGQHMNKQECENLIPPLKYVKETCGNYWFFDAERDLKPMVEQGIIDVEEAQKLFPNINVSEILLTLI